MSNYARLKYCDTTMGNRWPTGNTNLNLNVKDTFLLARSGLAFASFGARYEFDPTFGPVILVVRQHR